MSVMNDSTMNLAEYHACLVENFGSASVEQLQQLVAQQLTHFDGLRKFGPAPPAGYGAAQAGGKYTDKFMKELNHGASSRSPTELGLGVALPMGATSLLAAVLAAEPAAMALQGSDAAVAAPTKMKQSSLMGSSSLVIRGNIRSVLNVFINRHGSTCDEYVISEFWTSAEGVDRWLQVPETAFNLVSAPGSGDFAALRYLAKAVRNSSSPTEMARMLQEEAEGQQCLQTFLMSPTLGATVALADFWWDDVLDWLKGAVQWVQDAVSTFGELATKQAKALVDGVFARYPDVVHLLEEIPGIGLGVAAIYAVAGDSDHAMAALAINLNAIVTVAATSLGFAVGTPVGAMAGGAVGKAAGLQIQIWLAGFIHDPALRAEVGDISVTRYLIDVFLAGAVYGGAVGVAKTLATELAWSFVKKLGLSLTLAALLSEIPLHFVPPS